VAAGRRDPGHHHRRPALDSRGLAGWYIALSHLLIAVAEFITIIGIPFALKDLELAKLALAPVGATIRDKP
jgi:uncharacterized membrane protein YccF (DUF307 family)